MLCHAFSCLKHRDSTFKVADVEWRVAYTPVEARTLPKGRLVELDAAAAIWFEEKSKLFDGTMPLGCDSRWAIPEYLVPLFSDLVIAFSPSVPLNH